MRTVTIEVDFVLFTAGDTGKIETLSVEMKLILMILIVAVYHWVHLQRWFCNNWSVVRMTKANKYSSVRWNIAHEIDSVFTTLPVYTRALIRTIPYCIYWHYHTCIYWRSHSQNSRLRTAPGPDSTHNRTPGFSEDNSEVKIILRWGGRTNKTRAMALLVAADCRITLLLNIKCHHCMHNHKEANITNE